MSHFLCPLRPSRKMVFRSFVLFQFSLTGGVQTLSPRVAIWLGFLYPWSNLSSVKALLLFHFFHKQLPVETLLDCGIRGLGLNTPALKYGNKYEAHECSKECNTSGWCWPILVCTVHHWHNFCQFKWNFKISPQKKTEKTIMNSWAGKNEMLTFSHKEWRCLKCIHRHNYHWQLWYTIMGYILVCIFILNS